MRFDDFTDPARKAVEAANAEAKRAQRPQLTAEQLLLSLLDGKDTWAQHLWSYLGTQTATLRRAISDEVADEPRVDGQGEVYIAPTLLRVFEAARAGARALGAPSVSTGHVLLGLAEIHGTRAQKALAASLCGDERLRAAMRRVPDPEPPRAATAGGVPGPAARGVDDDEGTHSWLDKFSVDLTAKARDGELDPVIGRDDEIRRVMEVLCRRRKNNPVLVGEPGVGKTAILEGLAQRLAIGDVPDALRGRRLVSLDLASMVAGAKLRGAFEERLKHVLREVHEAAGQVLVFIDEIHQLAGKSGGGGVDTASMLKPALARGELHAIGATTPKEYRQSIDRDQALARRFQVVDVDEPSHEEALSILRGIKERYEVHHGVQVGDAALVASVALSSRYVSDRFLPDKAIDLVDEAASRLRLETDALPAEIDEVRRRVAQLTVEESALAREGSAGALAQRDAIAASIAELQKDLGAKTAQWKAERDVIGRIRQVKEEIEKLHRAEELATRRGQLALASEIRFGRLPEQSRKLATLDGELVVIQRDGGWLKEAIDAEDVAEVVGRWTGIPVTRLQEDEATKLLALEERLGERVIGQPEAIEAVANVVRRSRSGIQDPGRPLGSFLFLGPTGVGKTHLVKALTEELFDDPQALVRLDMSEYMEKHAVSRLVGAPPGYVGYEEGGQLTEAVRRRPFTVVLLDEVEKAHPEVFDLLLQVLDDGRLTDNMGRVVSFTNTLIVMTSNIGSAAILDVDPEGDDDAEAKAMVRDKAMEALHGFFRPEFLNRIDETVVFERLGREDVRLIVKLQIRELERRLAARDLELEVSDAALGVLSEEGYDPAYGARPVRRALRQLVEDPLAVALIAGRFEGARGLRVVTRAERSPAVETVEVEDTPRHGGPLDFERLEPQASE